MVVMKSLRDRNLYYLNGSAIIGTLAAAIDSPEDATQLRHKRLGHTGEKSMQTMEKQGLL